MLTHRFNRLWWRSTGLVTLVLISSGLFQTSAGAADSTRLYVGADKSFLLALNEPARKVSVANPNIADVQVMSPNQLLVNGKAVGVTTNTSAMAGLVTETRVKGSWRLST